jgi:hypothetical protein
MRHLRLITTPNRSKTMKRYVIEREVPGVGKLDRQQLKEAAATSNAALEKLSGKVQWVQSYLVDDKTFCIYIAENEDAVREHAKLSGFPANKISEVRGILEPMTAMS